MITRELGDIELDDYLRIVRPRPPWRRIRAIAAAGVCILCFVAGYTAPWRGKQVKDLGMADALDLLVPASREAWAREQGVYVMQEQLRTALEVLAEAAKEDGQPGQDASLALRNITRKGVALIQGLADLPERAEVHQESLRRIEADLRLK